MSKNGRLTALAIERAKPGPKDYYLSDDDGTRGGGRLVLRVSTAGTKLWYYRYSIDGVRKVVPMRPFTPRPAEGSYTLEQARESARGYAALHRNAETQDVAAHLAAVQEQRDAQTRAAATEVEQQRLQKVQAASFTVMALCEWYVEHLRRAGKVSANDARTIFSKNIHGTEWATLPARELTSKQAAALIRRVVDSGRGRTAAKLRAYLRAAYALAQQAELDPTAPVELTAFRIESNPVANTAALSRFNRARDRALSGAELGALWHHLTREAAPSAPLTHLAIRLSLLLGGQRTAQLLRVCVQDVNLEAMTITLHDPKGRRQAPRKHVLPIPAEAEPIVQALLARARALGAKSLFATKVAKPKGMLLGAPGAGEPDARETLMAPKTVSDAGGDIVAKLKANEEVLVSFQVRDLRRTAETIMASLGVSKDVRAQVQSHGLGGVQDRHYDRHDYMKEKLEAVQKLAGYLAARRQEFQDRHGPRSSTELAA